MKAPEVKERIQYLRGEINRYNHQYYVLNCSPVSDTDYDRLYRELVELEREYPQFSDSHSPTQRVGAVAEGFEKVKHADRRMLSLDNMRSAQEVIGYLGLEVVMMEPKIDGASLKLIYREGKLKQAVTRGNGMEGDDVTANARAIINIPLVLEENADLSVVGEVYMTYTSFNALNSKLEAAEEPLMANPRNAAAGALKLLDPRQVRLRELRFVAYGSTTELEQVTTQSSLTDYLEVLGFQSVYMLPTKKSTQTVADCFLIENERELDHRIAEANVHRQQLDLPTDGLVFKINDLRKQSELGEGTKYPKYACAFKYAPERRKTKLLSITNQVGRTGKITPVAELQPVELSGTSVKRASLCNQDEIRRLRVNVGDEVYVEKSAEIIPKVVGVAFAGYAFIEGKPDAESSGEPPVSTDPGTPLSDFSKKAYYRLPKKCPCCQAPLEQPPGYVDLYCVNFNCTDQVKGRLMHACGKSALDIDGCGETLIELLVQNGVTRISEVFTVSPAFLKTAARRRFESGRAAAADQPLWRKLHALGIDGFGQTLCQEVAARWNSLADALNIDKEKNINEARKLGQLVGEAVFNNIIDYCDRHSDEIDALDQLIGLSSTEEISGPLKGKTFCITGDLSSGSRNDVSRRIETAGGVIKTSVSRRVDYLVQGTETGRVKKEKAEKLGIPVISEQQLYALMGQELPSPKNVEEKEY